MTIGLGVVSLITVVVVDRPLAIGLLFLQYLLLALLLDPWLHTTVTLLRLCQGLAICLILLVTAGQAQSACARAGLPGVRRWEGLSLRVAAAAVCGLLAYGLMRAFPRAILHPDLNFAFYWLLCGGLVSLLISERPSHAGIGLLTLINGFEVLYLSLEKSLLVMGMLGIINILLALAIAFYAENWLAVLPDRTLQ